MRKISELTDKTVLMTADKTSEKAIAVKGEIDLRNTMVWFPKSQCEIVENDFYTNINKMFFIPKPWILQAKISEGYLF